MSVTKSGYINIYDLKHLAYCLNIEGCRPAQNLPEKCKWLNLVYPIDYPLSGDTFDHIMDEAKKNNYQYLEQARIGHINMDDFIDKLVILIKLIKKDYPNLLVHIHQYEGSTILNKTLENRTGVKCILDKTNYHENPVNYKEEYPDIDALFSLSQCANLESKFKNSASYETRFTIPNYYMDFDVKENIIYTQPIYAMNYIQKYIEQANKYGYTDLKQEYDLFEIADSNVLVVNDLWNPKLVRTRTHRNLMPKSVDYLMLDKEGKMVLDFVKKHTTTFDESHNWQHAVLVAINSIKILNTKEVLYLALLHDVCDHKYLTALPRNKLTEFINKNLKQNLSVDIDKMIDQISFSRQKRLSDPHVKVHPVLEAVRDGDRLEAIGDIGVKRCEIFTIEFNKGIVPEDVVQHCFDKLIRLVPERFIINITNETRKRHNIMVDYVNKYCTLDQYNKNIKVITKHNELCKEMDIGRSRTNNIYVKMITLPDTSISQ
jgi:uncharacterized protein